MRSISGSLEAVRFSEQLFEIVLFTDANRVTRIFSPGYRGDGQADRTGHRLRWDPAPFPRGGGFGTFPEIYPRFQSPDAIGYINHAHNDYLEWLMEGGFLAAVILLALLWFYARRWREVWEAGNWSTFRFIQVGAGIGLLVMGLHGIVDFNFHFPANAVYYAFMAVVFFREESPPAGTSAPEAVEPEGTAPRVDTQSVPREIQINPFAE